MKLYFDKLAAHLARSPFSLYLIHGDEPWQLMQAADRLRAHARAQGHEEREVIIVNEDADWERFSESAASLSLFAERRILDLRIPNGKPGRKGGEALKAFAENPPADIFLLIQSAKLDGSATRAAWFKAVDKAGGVVALWPLPHDQLPAWLDRRLRDKGLVPDAEALRLLAERVEGNLLAADQEIERLSLLCDSGPLGAREVLDTVSNSARYSPGDLADAALTGDPARALRVLEGLLQEGVAETLLLWTLAQDIRAAARTAEAVAEGVPMERAMQAAGVWKSRYRHLARAVPRHPAGVWLAMLSMTSHIDRQIKGQAAGSVPDALATLVATLAGRDAALLQPARIGREYAF
ncbi:MAG: DNA polymerase III subunit delta [Gammaproteobacteria bacterium]|nr:MAG: DNA polymerase III subunit delta [Gammaproteobacteria bacterium]